MTASASAVDYATYRRRPVDVWAGADETNRTERQVAGNARLINMMAGLAVTTLPAFLQSLGWTKTHADYSILGKYVSQVGPATSVPVIPVISAPLPFVDAYYEMLSYKALEDGWDDFSSKGISAEAVDAALAFLALLPPDISPPDASASGDGTVDWFWRNDGRSAIVTFYPNGLVAYFAKTGAGRAKGRFKFSGSVPEDLVKSLLQL